MEIFVYSKQREIAQIIVDHLSSKDHCCFIFYKLEDLKNTIEKKSFYPDLLILDYQTFNHDYFNIYHHFERRKYHIPVIYYNDPCLIKPSRKEHWLSLVETTQNFYLKLNLETYKPVFQDLEELIESHEFKPYISLLAPPLPLPHSMIKDPLTLAYLKEMQNDCIYDFKNKINLQPSLFYLLEILQNNKSEPMTIDEILSVYEQDNKPMTKPSLKVLISRLRAKIRQHPECGFLINCSNQKYRFVRYKTYTSKNDTDIE